MPTAVAARGPNILVVMADQLAPHHTGTYGHPLVRTPTMDALAERGMRFDAHYCHSPLCAPARFSMLTGQAIHRIGAYDNAAELRASVPTVAHYLRLIGYRTCLSGKMHFVGPDQLHGFEERLTTDIYPADFGWTPNWDQPDARIDKWYHGMDTLHGAGQAAVTYQLEYDDEVGFSARRRLFDYARDNDERPFFMVVSFIHPHDPYVARPEWWELYDHDDIDIPEPVDLSSLDPHALRIRAGIQADAVGYTDEHVRNSRHGYYANTSYFDHWVGQLVATLDETDRADDTVIIVTSDHGDMLGDRGLWFKMAFYERSARVPFIMAGPGVRTGVASEVNSHLDLLPTVLDIASEHGGWSPELAAPVDGRSLWERAAGGSDGVDETFCEYAAEMTSYPMFMIRRGRHKYIHCDTDPPLLFDLVTDPGERFNLADDPETADLAAAFAVEVHDRWDSQAIREDVLASQRNRRMVHDSMEVGRLASWDYSPPQDAAREYVRSHMNWSEVGPRTRYPPLSS